ncbi:hypothetical protein FBEOM_3158 [Fusarium beomiforme]|uniref:Uncharacterized protein n=1 Tax=Fusarium beomiforme TaxID=44412 RepID=A0A9P5AQP4_9HYPO|nr:hypothetical protein FBEOM_3158 [Fusarium beomiforme]
MMSNRLPTSFAQPPASLHIEKSCQLESLKSSQEAKQEIYPSSSSGSNLKTFSPASQRALRDYLCSSNSARVSSVDAHTPPSGSGKPDPKVKARHNIKTRRNANTEVDQRHEHHQPKALHRFQFTIPEAETQRKQLEDDNWHSIYPHPCNENYPKDEFNFKPKVLAKQIDPELPLSLHTSHNDTDFLEPLALEAANHGEYSVHVAYKKHQHGMSVKKINDERRAVAEHLALRKHDVDPNVNPTKFPKVSSGVQRAIYADKVDLAALTRKVAIQDGHVEAIIAREFTFYLDTCHLPPTEEQMAVLREADSLIVSRGCSRRETEAFQQIFHSEALALDEEVALAKKKAYNKAFSKQIKCHFPSLNSPDMKGPPKVVGSDNLEWETNYFPCLLPETEYDAKRRNIYGIVHFNRRDSTEKQYKEFLTQIWRLESKMRSNKNNKPVEQKFCHTYHEGQNWDTFEKPMPHDLVEQDVVSSEFSFDDVFDMDEHDNIKASGNKKPEIILKEIEQGVRKAIAKVGV